MMERFFFCLLFVLRDVIAVCVACLCVGTLGLFIGVGSSRVTLEGVFVCGLVESACV